MSGGAVGQTAGGVQPLMSSQPLMSGGQDSAGSAGPGPATSAGPQQQQMPMKFDIGQILSVIRSNMSATGTAPPHNNNE